MADLLSDISLLPEEPAAAGAENTSFRKKLRDAFRSKSFDQFLTSLIVIFAVTLALLSYLEAQAEPNLVLIGVLKVLDISIFSAFCAELLLKIYAFRGRFFTHGWNLFDFAVILISIIGCLLYTSPSPRDLSTSRMPSSA